MPDQALYELLDRAIETVKAGHRTMDVSPEEYRTIRQADPYEIEAYVIRNLSPAEYGQTIDLMVKPDLRTIPVTVTVVATPAVEAVHEEPPSGVRHMPSPGVSS